MNNIDQVINAFATLVVTIDPPGMAPIFLGLTAGLDRRERFQTAVRGTLIAFFILVGFALLGETILATLGISMGAFRIAGGLLLFTIAFEMIFSKREERKQKTTETAINKDHLHNLAVFPLALPLIAGPGAISATVLLAGSFSGPLDRLMLIGVLAVCIALVFAALVIAGGLDRLLGNTGRNILTRLLGVLLAAMSVQFVVDGIKATML
ncbi:MarC family protein [Rhizobium sp. L1K21]|uniref:MarC family protein n=1 Tax=Rhizobium sp. L1K21 TaxID=2954933 RepID=UPI00209335B2|nr:MarC family protein [Rhizobium sp. L1K21]MCO6186080.1 MarC family protein [Rhizobium sp. L1K21]